MIQYEEDFVRGAFEYHGMLDHYGSSTIGTVYILRTKDYNEDVVCFDCERRKWYQKERDSFYDFFDSRAMLSLMVRLNEEDAIRKLREAGAFILADQE